MKRYIKSAVNISDIQAKIAKKQAEIDKKRAWIEKKEEAIKKKLALLKGKISDDEYDALVVYLDALKNLSWRERKTVESVNTWALVRKYDWDYSTPEGKALYSIDDDAEAIYNSNEAIKEIEKIIEGYKAKLAALKDKADEIDRIPDCLKDFMNDIIKRWDKYDISLRDRSKVGYQEIKQAADKILYGDGDSNSYSSYKVSDAKLKEMYPQIKYSYERSNAFKKEYIIRPFELEFGSLNYAMSLWDMSDEKIHAENQKAGENLILDLLKRVTKITGPVRDWSDLHTATGNSGMVVLNGIVIGEDGKARVESILAGGYSVQRLHVRTLVKPVR